MEDIKKQDLVSRLNLYHKTGSLDEEWIKGSNAIVKAAFTNGTRFFKSLGNTQLDAVDSALAGALATILCGMSALFSDTAALTPKYKAAQSLFMSNSDNKEIDTNEDKKLRRPHLYEKSVSDRQETFKDYVDEHNTMMRDFNALPDDQKL